ncbi:hypothetical protein PPL_00083 [Heterostelium album PN500]|uniref:Uncharacterized protein n=1 Tax=Heterostelium pallidum (strain ATCC 26659 / Pp 5 / PN500) TaxID=670386 RepID=D3AVH2_HETP5|nr:hypothetical protein PPL_00083 [Heterostelium album PN500]EFA86295.1 hypothetical protein PPL_00083 [Heterostelium album PN500]|eukprot:XP_020438400.1 hypothetical protein PPL_00083 [Heterostelium album PN500]
MYVDRFTDEELVTCGRPTPIRSMNKNTMKKTRAVQPWLRGVGYLKSNADLSPRHISIYVLLCGTDWHFISSIMTTKSAKPILIDGRICLSKLYYKSIH